jgi:hypothetical protein
MSVSAEEAAEPLRKWTQHGRSIWGVRIQGLAQGAWARAQSHLTAACLYDSILS